MSLVKNKEVVKYFEKPREPRKIKCGCETQAQIKHCRKNCNNTSFHKINYDS